MSRHRISTTGPQICRVCFRTFANVSSLKQHHTKTHPTWLLNHRSIYSNVEDLVEPVTAAPTPDIYVPPGAPSINPSTPHPPAGCPPLSNRPLAGRVQAPQVLPRDGAVGCDAAANLPNDLEFIVLADQQDEL